MAFKCKVKDDDARLLDNHNDMHALAILVGGASH